MKEAGEYIRSLRKERGMTMQALAGAAGVHPNYIWRVETGDIKKPSNKNLGALVHALKGSMEEVTRLMALSPSPEELSASIIDQLGRLSPKEREEYRRKALELIDELLTDPHKLDRWMGYGARLLDEDRHR